MAQKALIVSPTWLKACGLTKWEGVPMTILFATDWGHRGIQYDVVKPDGTLWVVFDWRGVTIVEGNAA